MTADPNPNPLPEAAILLKTIDTMSDGLILLNSQDRFVLCNERYRQFYPEVLDKLVPGTPLDEIITTYSHRIGVRAGEDVEDFARRRNEAWRAGTSMEEVTPAGLRIETRDYRTDTGYWIGIRIDVTRQREAEQRVRDLNRNLEQRVAERSRELAEAQEALLRRERLSILGQLTGTVAHELRNPLGTLSSSLAVIERKLAKRDLGVDSALGRASRSIQRCNTIIEELLGFARTSKGEPEVTLLDKWLSETLADIDVPEDVALKQSLDAAGARVCIDHHRFQRAIVNVIMNAIDAVKSTVVDSEPEVRISSEVVGDHAYVLVADNGAGIPEDMMQRIFDPLVSTKSFGIGLGLPLVVRILEEHGGALEVSNRAAGGTIVKLSLPLC